jgi:hypothetical protein
MSKGLAPPVGTLKYFTAPVVLMFTIMLRFSAVNHRLPSAPAAIPTGVEFPVGTSSSVTTPAGVILPIWPSWGWVNQTLPSGPVAMP